MRISRSVALVAFSLTAIAAGFAVRAIATTLAGPLYVYDSADAYAIRGSSTSSGIASGIAGTSLNGNGVYGLAQSGAFSGVLGSNSAYGPGVKGTSSSVGVYGISNLIGVKGTTTNQYVAVDGEATAGTVGGTGVSGEGHVGVIGGGNSTEGSSVGLLGQSNGSVGAALGAMTLGSGALEMVAHNLLTSQDVMSLDENGTMILAGTLTTYSSPAIVVRSGGASHLAYAPANAESTIEDGGDGRIAFGSGFVAIDPALAAALDPRKPYQVFVTPKGDCRGLFVASKTPRGFYVRELMGGRSSVAFSYRIAGAPATSRTARLPLYADPLRRIPVRHSPPGTK